MDQQQILILAGFHVFIILMLFLDMGVIRRRAHTVSMREAAIWSTVWLVLALTFGLVGIRSYWGLWDPAHPEDGPHKALEYVTGYLVEFSLSVDNLFVFLVIFRYFGVPDHLRHRVLFWGILGAVVLRAAFIVFGAVLLHLFSWTIYLFAILLLWTAYSLLTAAEKETDPEKNPLLRLARRFLPLVHDYDSPTFWVRREGRWYATPLPLVLLVVETTDVMFAVDSIPAIFGITQDPFVVYTSNIFAILGLRSLYFLLANFLGMFRYLNVGLGLVLGFVGVKMIVEGIFESTLEEYGLGQRERILISFGVIVAILTTAAVASVLAGPKEPVAAPEVVTEKPPENPRAAVATMQNVPTGESERNPHLEVIAATRSIFKAQDCGDSRFYIRATLGSGLLRFEVVAQLADGTRGKARGREFFAAMMAHFGASVIIIEGTWTRVPGLRINLDQANAATARGLTVQSAAGLTWTGLRASEYGYDRVEVVKALPLGAQGRYEEIRVRFMKA